jgi:hypothetical protein
MEEGADRDVLVVRLGVGGRVKVVGDAQPGSAGSGAVAVYPRRPLWCWCKPAPEPSPLKLCASEKVAEPIKREPAIEADTIVFRTFDIDFFQIITDCNWRSNLIEQHSANTVGDCGMWPPSHFEKARSFSVYDRCKAKYELPKGGELNCSSTIAA